MLKNTKTKQGRNHLVSILVVLTIFVAGFYIAYQFGLIKNFRFIPPTPFFKDCTAVQQEIEKYSWNTETALAIAKSESECDANARKNEDSTYQQRNRDYGYSVGVFQIRIEPGQENCDSYDIATNVKCAYDIYKKEHDSFRSWGSYSTGKYKQYLWRSLEDL